MCKRSFIKLSFAYLNLYISSKLSVLVSSCSSKPINLLPFSISSALKSTSRRFFRPPPPFLSGARFSVLAIAAAASFFVYVSGKHLKAKAILNLSSSEGVP